MTLSDEENIIEKTSNLIYESGLSLPAILFLQSFKSLSYIGGTSFRLFISPFLFIKEKEITKMADVFEKQENIELLIDKIEERLNNK
jgi:hypothetical protein